MAPPRFTSPVLRFFLIRPPVMLWRLAQPLYLSAQSLDSIGSLACSLPISGSSKSRVQDFLEGEVLIWVDFGVLEGTAATTPGDGGGGGGDGGDGGGGGDGADISLFSLYSTFCSRVRRNTRARKRLRGISPPSPPPPPATPLPALSAF